MSRSRPSGGPWAAAALSVAAVVATALVLGALLSPEAIDPLPVDAERVFGADQVDRARDFRGPQRLLGLAVLAVQVAFLLALVLHPPAFVRRRWRRPLLAAAGAGAALAVAVTAVALPLRAVARARSLDVGLTTRSWPGWAADVALGAAISAVLAGVGAVIAVALVRRAPRRWWIGAAGVVTAFGVVQVLLWPVLVDPLFNRYRSLPDGPLRAEVERLARAADVRVGAVQVVDASRRTTAANARVAGLGATKRVVLDDTLLRTLRPREVRFVVAHELAHQRDRDLERGLLVLALLALPGAFALRQVTRAGAGEAEVDAGPRTVVALALAVLVVPTVVTWATNPLSRAVEARADTTALELTRDPAAFAAQQRRLALRNLSDPDPPPLAQAVLATHPSTVQRLGMARAYSQGRR